ncbi:hypothetical protein GGR42_000562 [Saonia flava]|uniref:Uncharacterized protein n=1 Tax=Saonia flava TaxID=523696 RepID=A0A846QT11_9FLAO|nr:hypothetical protein [Saonia flava]NJB70100.1 hypothetical protein [Saonia flava]
MKPKFWTSEKVLSLSALLVSLLTLAVFIYQTQLIRKQQYMSVYPHLNFANIGGHTLEYTYVLKNDGVGPAFIRSVKVNGPNGKSYKDVINYVEENLAKNDSVLFYYANLSEGRLVSAEEEIPIITLMNKEKTRELNLSDNTLEKSNKLYDILNNDSLKIEIEYESIYGEKWVLKNGGSGPVKK